MKTRKPKGISTVEELQGYLGNVEGNIPASKTITIRVPFSLWVQFIRDRITGDFPTLNDYLLFRLGESNSSQKDGGGEGMVDLISTIEALENQNTSLEELIQNQSEEHESKLINVNNRIVELHDKVGDFDKGIPFDALSHHRALNPVVKEHNHFVVQELQDILSEMNREEEDYFEEEE